MSKLLYSQSTQAIKPYPRLDDALIAELDPDYLVLDKVEAAPISYDPATQSLSSTYVVDTDTLEYRQEWTVTDLPPVPNWDGFNLAFSTLPSLLQAEMVANNNHPSIVGKKDLAYLMIDTHGTETFNLIFPLFCQAGQVTIETRIEWAELAQTFNMPADFVAIIRG